MRAYILTTGIVFGLLVVAHVLRVAAEGIRVAADPLFAVTTLAAAGLCIWAVALLKGNVPARHE
jgi:hypothetical protein